MRRLAALALVVAASWCAAGARADTFAVVGLPTAALPNLPGAVAFPASLSTPPVAPVVLGDAELLSLWQSAGAAYGIPWTVLAAINKVESNFGRNMGPSSAGAIGWMQFMPSTWSEWGVDANADGVADPWNPVDAVYSAARYLAASGGGGDLAQAVFSYNHAGWYVNEVLSLAQVYGQGAGVTFELDRAQASLDAARAAVARAGQRLAAAQARARGKALLSARLDAQPSVERARATLAAARARLAQAQTVAAPVSFSPSLAAVFGAPSYSGGWAFPVGGGAGVVSVAHTHHDYPAADIAAPSGSPVYALSAGVVERTWTDDPKCGIGFRFQSADGQRWTYCHLADLEPTVTMGAPLAAGAQVGLVGSTGDATGPHLHLQLDPSSSYPQDEQWFAAFAGSAFTWQDGGTALEQAAVPGIRFLSVSMPTAAPQHPVYAVAPSDPAPVVLFNRP